jgi:hypothetical protein
VLGERGSDGQLDTRLELANPFPEHPDFGHIGAAAPGGGQDEVAGKVREQLKLAPEQPDKRGRDALDLLCELFLIARAYCSTMPWTLWTSDFAVSSCWSLA